MIKKFVLLAIAVTSQLGFLNTAFGYDWGYGGNYYFSDKNVYPRYGSVEACATLENTQYYHSKDGCYLSFAFLDENPSLCFKVEDVKTQVDRDVSLYPCFDDIAVKMKDVSVCDYISKKNLPNVSSEEIVQYNAKCRRLYAEYYQQKDICYTIDDKKEQENCIYEYALREDPKTVEDRTNFFTNYFAVPGIILFLVALILVRIFWRNVLETFVLVHAIIAMILISLARYYFNIEDVSWIADGDGNMHTLLWLLFALMCLYGVEVGFSGALKSLREEGEQSFSGKIRKTCIIIGIYTMLISAVAAFGFEKFVFYRVFSAILFFGVAFLAVVGVWFISYGVRARALLTDPGLRKWMLFLIGLGIVMIIAGGGPLILIGDFWLNGEMRIF